MQNADDGAMALSGDVIGMICYNEGMATVETAKAKYGLIPAETTFIDCDTHSMPLRALERIARVHSDQCRLIVEDQVLFIYQGRVVAHGHGGFDLLVPKGGAASMGRTLEERVPYMDQKEPGTVHVLGFPQSLCRTGYVPRVGTDLAKALNDANDEMLEEAGPSVRSRFIPLAAVYLPWVQGAVQEIERAHKLGFKGVFIGPSKEPHEDLSLSDRNLWGVLETLCELDMPIVYHNSAQQWTSPDRVSYNMHKTYNPTLVGANHKAMNMVFDLGSVFGFPFTYAFDIAALIFSGALDRFPTLRLCVLEGRVPGFVPALMDALDQVEPSGPGFKLERKPSEYFSQVYPAATANERWLHQTVQAWPDHNIVLGSDYPHQDVSGTYGNTIRMISENPKLSEEDKSRILVRNARRLFKV